MKIIRTSIITLIALVTLIAPIFLSSSNQVSALSGSSFQAGRIIDDSIFTNKNSMTVQQIQDFLNAKGPACDIHGTQTIYDSTYKDTVTRAVYSQRRGYPAPFTCLKDYQENPSTGANNFGQYNSNGSPAQISGGQSSAQIIWNAAQTYTINPQALIVLLQKEQGIVTDDWPWISQYNSATGYECPDTAPCSAAKAGFSKQVIGAAWQFRNDFNGIGAPGTWGAFGKGWNNILYSPNTACGTKRVYIETQATAVLYKYTPYTPDTAALNNLYGTGDTCSSYGNRNFWRYFNDWFGSSLNGASAQQNFWMPHPTGALIKSANGGPVYKIIDGYRLLIPNYSVFRSQNYKDSQIKYQNQGDVSIPLSPKALGYRNGTLVRELSDVKIYAIECTTQYYDSCTKQHISNYATFVALGYNANTDVLVVPNGDLSNLPQGPNIDQLEAHPIGTLVNDSSQNMVYLIEDGSRYHVLTAMLFNLYRFDWSKIKTINNYDKQLPISAGFPAMDSNILAQATGDVRIYAVSVNTSGTTYKVFIPSYETFTLLGYTSNDVLPLESSIVNSLPSVSLYSY